MRMSRGDCFAWFKKNKLPEPPRSACIFCPFRSNNEWRLIKNNPKEWADAVYIDKVIRKKGGVRGDLFLHADRIPLDEIDLTTPEDHGQMTLFDNECAGVCGV